MAVTTANHSTGLVRCAVCKIDFKGRFVYIDDDIEQLLGRTKEELFGRSLAEFLDPRDEALINQLLSERNHYETFHEATRLTIIDGSGKAIPIRAIVSLNFNAGNPVNLQMVLDVGSEEAAPAVAEPSSGPPVAEFVSAVLALDGPSELKPFLELLIEFAEAESAALYLIGEGVLEPRAGAFRDQSIEHAFQAMPEPTETHCEVAVANGEYSFLDEQAVARAVEEAGHAPAELVTCLSLGGSRYLLVLTFPDELGPLSAQACLEKAQMGIGLARRILADTGSASSAAIDIKFTVGFLDHLGIGALLTQADGGIIGYNRALVTLLGEVTPGDSPAEFVNLLRQSDDSEELSLLTTCFDLSGSSGERGDFEMTVKLPSRGAARMHLMWLGEQSNDLSSAIVLLPVSEGPTITIPSADEFWTSVTDALRSELLAISDGLQQWSHLAYSVEQEVEGETVRSITAAARAIKGTLSELDGLSKVDSAPGLAQPTDLTLLLADLMDEVKAWYPEVEADCMFEGPPKIMADREFLRQVLRNLISNSVKFCRRDHVDITVSAAIEEDICRLQVSDDGEGIPPDVLDHVFQYGWKPDSSQPAHTTGAGMSLSLTRELVKRMGGELRIESPAGQGAQATLTLLGQSHCQTDSESTELS